ncbi:MAG: hypothetical protein LBC72_05710 [Spirochaetaceae bacterium]|jgi:hypothetical protein|nr:hypothetical protein [Spirochaetaceae bacterium]
MAVTPLDVQTVFTQLDKIGKEQAAARDGAALQKAVRGEMRHRKTEERMLAVVEAEQTGEGLSGIDSREQEARHHDERKKHPPKEDHHDDAEGRHKRAAYHDPDVGKHLDISG